MSVQNAKIMFQSAQSPNEPQETKNDDIPPKKQRQLRKTLPNSRSLVESDPKTSSQFNLLSVSMGMDHLNVNMDDVTARRLLKNNSMDRLINCIPKENVKNAADRQISPSKARQNSIKEITIKQEEISRESLKESQGKSALFFLKNTGREGSQQVDRIVSSLRGAEMRPSIEEQSDRQSSVIIRQSQRNINGENALKLPTIDVENKQKQRVSRQSSSIFKQSLKRQLEVNHEQCQSADNLLKAESVKSSSSVSIFKRSQKGMVGIGRQKSESSSSDDGNIFRVTDKRQCRVSLKSTNNNTNYTLQRILLSCNVYKSYLFKMQRRITKKASFDVPQLQSVNQLPKQLYFKPIRVEFRKITDFAPNFLNNGGSNYLCKINGDRTRLFFQDLKLQQTNNNLNGPTKCGEIVLSQEQKMSSTAEYDYINRRIYLFSNKEQKIFVYSEASLELLGKVPVQKSVNEPQLYFYHTNSRNFLLVLGGYVRIQKQIVQGSKFIEIFQIHRWEVSLKSRIIKLIIGRICPVVLTVKQRNENRLLILGGNSIGKVSRDGELSFDYETDINESTNMTGISISSQQILEMFDYDEQAIYSNLSVKMTNPLSLHSGLVIAISNVFLLILPRSCFLFQAKIVSKEINIVESSYVTIPEASIYQRRQLYLKIQRETASIYRISEKGMLEIITLTNGEKDERMCCSIY